MKKGEILIDLIPTFVGFDNLVQAVSMFKDLNVWCNKIQSIL